MALQTAHVQAITPASSRCLNKIASILLQLDYLSEYIPKFPRNAPCV